MRRSGVAHRGTYLFHSVSRRDANETAETADGSQGASAHGARDASEDTGSATSQRKLIRSAVGHVARRVPGSKRIRRRIRDGTPLWVAPVRVTQARDRGQPPTDPDTVLARYEASKVTDEPDDFVLYRIIGNDLPPRHETGQARRNLAFILENEPELQRCEKRFVVNRIVDGDEEEKIVELLEQAGVTYLRIPFRWEEYAQAPLDTAGVPERYAPRSKRYAWLRHDQQERVCARLDRNKNNYAMNNNGARNTALDDGRSVAKWILPWDGNCFLPQNAYDDIREAVAAHPEVPYVLVRMVRLDDNQQALAEGLSTRAVEEPQLVFRRDASLRFDTAFPYGRRPKVELLWRLGVPGPWDEWGIEPWDLPCPPYHEDAGAFDWAGWVARLAPAPEGHGTTGTAATERTMTRRRAIRNFLRSLDRRVDGLGPHDAER